MNCACAYCLVLSRAGVKREVMYTSLPKSLVAQRVISFVLLSLVLGCDIFLPVRPQIPDKEM